jgi:hypothetical protein
MAMQGADERRGEWGAALSLPSPEGAAGYRAAYTPGDDARPDNQRAPSVLSSPNDPADLRSRGRSAFSAQDPAEPPDAKLPATDQGNSAASAPQINHLSRAGTLRSAPYIQAAHGGEPVQSYCLRGRKLVDRMNLWRDTLEDTG